MNCPACGTPMITLSTRYVCTNLGRHQQVSIPRNYDAPSDPMDELGCDSCQ